MSSCKKAEYFLYILLLLFMQTTAVKSEPNLQCEDEATTFKYNNQLIQVTRERRYSTEEFFTMPYTAVILSPCYNATKTVFKDLDTEEIFSMYDHAEIWNVTLPPMVNTSVLNEVKLYDISPKNVWGHCEVSYLYIQRVDTSSMPRDWLSNCSLLYNLYFDSVSVLQIRDILDSIPKVETVSMINVIGIVDILDHPLFPTPRGKEKFIGTMEMGFPDYDESWAKLTSEDWAKVSAALIQQLSTLHWLRELKITEFKFFQFCATNFLQPITFNNLHYFAVESSDTTRLCFKKYILMPKIEEIHLMYNPLSEIEFRELYSAPAPKLSINFDEGRMLRFRFSREDYLALTEGHKRGEVTISGKLRLECDCGGSLWLARAMRENLVKLSDVACADQSHVESQQCELMECNRVYCAGPCVCCGGDNGTVSADCRETRLAELPGELLQGSNLTHILAPSTGLTTLPNHLPDSLKFLDVSGNNVWLKSTAEEARTLFKELRKVRLAGNTVVCSCDNEPLLKVLQENRDQIEDYEAITCVDDGRQLSNVDLKALCASRDRNTAVLISVSVALVLAATGLALGTAYYYRRQLQIFLFARGWCLGCIQEEELDADMEYDVFLSFCHADEQLVVEQLLRRLDSEYSVCVHFRDWCVGEGIPVQIARSVERARRTLVALSRGFVASLWGPLEFRTAHARALAEGRTRLVLLVLDDVLCAELDADIRAYVRLNTYLQWGDPFFWDKLKFALPHHPRPRVKHEYVVSNESNHGVIRMNMLEN